MQTASRPAVRGAVPIHIYANAGTDRLAKLMARLQPGHICRYLFANIT